MFALVVTTDSPSPPPARPSGAPWPWTRADAEERERHLQWLESAGELKLRVGDLVRGHVPVLADLESLAFLNELVVLDQFPLTSSPGAAVHGPVATPGPHRRPALQDAMDRLREEVIDRIPGKARRWS